MCPLPPPLPPIVHVDRVFVCIWEGKRRRREEIQATCATHFTQTKGSDRERGSERRRRRATRRDERKGKGFCYVAFDEQSIKRVVSLTEKARIRRIE